MNGAISTGIQTPAASKKKCIICSEPAPLACGNCKVAQYCSSECQSTDWKVHKLLCKSFEEFRVRPGKDYRHAIVFGHKKQKPRFIWVECPKNEQGIEDGGENLDKIVGGKHDAITIDANPVRNRNLSDYIEANIKAEHNYTRDTFRSEHSQKYSNECLYFVVLYSKAWLDEMNAWYGNVVFMVSKPSFPFCYYNLVPSLNDLSQSGANYHDTIRSTTERQERLTETWISNTFAMSLISLEPGIHANR